MRFFYFVFRRGLLRDGGICEAIEERLLFERRLLRGQGLQLDDASLLTQTWEL